MTKFMTKDFSEGGWKQSRVLITWQGEKIEFINHFGLSGVGILVLIYCQIVAGSVVQHWEQGGDGRLVPSPWCCREQLRVVGQSPRQGRSLPWMGAHASRSPTAERTGAQLS